MKLQLAFAPIAFACLAAAAHAADKSQDDVDAIQGDWRIESIEADGQNLTNDLTSKLLKNVVVRVEQDKIGLVDGGGKQIVSTVMTLSAEATPKAADFKPTEDALGVFNGESMWGIYELTRDEMKICVSTNTAIKQRPVEFKTQPGSSVYLVVLKRPQ